GSSRPGRFWDGQKTSVSEDLVSCAGFAHRATCGTSAVDRALGAGDDVGPAATCHQDDADEEDDDARAHQDVSDQVEIRPVDLDVQGEGEDRADHEQHDSGTDAHGLLRSYLRRRGAAAPLRLADPTPVQKGLDNGFGAQIPPGGRGAAAPGQVAPRTGGRSTSPTTTATGLTAVSATGTGSAAASGTS